MVQFPFPWLEKFWMAPNYDKSPLEAEGIRRRCSPIGGFSNAASALDIGSVANRDEDVLDRL